MADTDTTCPRHPKRDGEPVLCVDCTNEARTATWRLPEQHRQLLGTLHATRARAERRSVGGAPPSISPWYDHADDIHRTLAYWAGSWAEATGRSVPDTQPATSARLLLDTRHGCPFTTPAAPDLAREILRLHHTAARLLGDQEEHAKPRRRRAAGPCPGCSAAALYRTDDTDRIRCGNCPATLTAAEYAAYARALAAAHQGAA